MSLPTATRLGPGHQYRRLQRLPRPGQPKRCHLRSLAQQHHYGTEIVPGNGLFITYRIALFDGSVVDVASPTAASLRLSPMQSVRKLLELLLVALPLEATMLYDQSPPNQNSFDIVKFRLADGSDEAIATVVRDKASCCSILSRWQANASAPIASFARMDAAAWARSTLPCVTTIGFKTGRRQGCQARHG